MSRVEYNAHAQARSAKIQDGHLSLSQGSLPGDAHEEGGKEIVKEGKDGLTYDRQMIEAGEAPEDEPKFQADGND